MLQRSDPQDPTQPGAGQSGRSQGHFTGRPRFVAQQLLVEVVYTRERCLHAIDICRATGRHVDIDAGHDARIVAEWAAIHGPPYRLTLDGPAGGVFERGEGGEQHHLDTIEFCRIVSGRQHGTGLLPSGRVLARTVRSRSRDR